MTKAFNVEVENLPNLLETLKEKSELKKEVGKVLNKGALRIERDAKIFAPVNRGVLRASIHTVKISELSFKVADGVEYGIFQEIGTKYISGVHFMQRAAKKNTKKISGEIKALYKK